jgi:hypothetical protein
MAHTAAQQYASKAGISYQPVQTFARVDQERAERIAQAYDEMKHAPQDPLVKAAYDAMISETLEQYRAILATGLKVEFIDFAKQGDPYASSPRAAIQDVIKNNHLFVFSTRDGFGSSDFDPEQPAPRRDGVQDLGPHRARERHLPRGARLLRPHQGRQRLPRRRRRERLALALGDVHAARAARHDERDARPE